ncbi:MAG: putative nucleotide-diphospho-sugar transferase [Candidatus Omnitrophica bacterium]|nr:putative nucleotide-diphospho-sugar transferase [Candidatus Omnitrophota bacterium]
MKLYAFYTPSHSALKENWFIPSLQDDYELTIRQMEQIGQERDHLYRSSEFKQTVLRKVELIIQAIQDTWGEVFIFSDVDVYFFRPSQRTLMKLIKGRDMLFQRNSSKGELCTGFFVCRANQKTLNLWTDAGKCMLENEDKDDQDALNYLLFEKLSNKYDKRKYCLVKSLLAKVNRWDGVSEKIALLLTRIGNDYQIKWTYLPREFFSPGIVNECIWRPDMEFPVPRNIIMHHANWTVGVKNKIAQLKYVRDVVNKRAKA